MSDTADKSAIPAVAGVSLTALAVALGLTTKWEGERTKPYQDIVGKWTVCYGETNVPMKPYTPAQCREFLVKAIRGPYGRGVLKCVPALQSAPYQLGASIDHAYNFGVSAYCGSTIARQFNAGDWYAACRAFEPWENAARKRVQGLANRRVDDMRACFTNLPPERTLTIKVAS